jgi:hypothetical protein
MIPLPFNKRLVHIKNIKIENQINKHINIKMTSESIEFQCLLVSDDTVKDTCSINLPLHTFSLLNYLKGYLKDYWNICDELDCYACLDAINYINNYDITSDLDVHHSIEYVRQHASNKNRVTLRFKKAPLTFIPII